MAKQPNILIIWGDDIGWFNVSAYNHGMMGYRTPNIDRIAKEGRCFTDWYGQQSCTAGRAAFITGQSPIRTGLTKVGLPGADLGLQPEDPTIADAAQAARLRHRPVRQEPPRRPRRVPADGARLRRVLRQPLPPERRGGAGEPGLSEGPRVQEEVRPARRAAQLGQRRRHAEDRGHRPADHEAHGDGGRGVPRREPRLHGQGAQADDKPFFVWWNSTRMHIFTHLKKESQGKTGLGVYPDGMVEHDGQVGQAARQARRARHRRQHHRDVLDRQRRRGHELARRRHDAVPRREGHQLGGRLARALRDPLARRDQAGHRVQRDLLAHRTCCRRCSPPPASPTSSRS